ncbi:universal stress protein [Bacillota bacterium]
MKSILVPVDGSENAERAILKAKEIADCLGCKIILLHIINVRSAVAYYHNNARLAQNPAALDWPGIIKKSKEDSKHILEKAKQTLGDSDVETVTIDEPGSRLADAIVAFGEDRDVDMIIMGSNGMGSLGRRLYMGSVTTRVLHTTERPVLVVQ